jgi:hypothetical protein
VGNHFRHKIKFIYQQFAFFVPFFAISVRQLTHYETNSPKIAVKNGACGRTGNGGG